MLFLLGDPAKYFTKHLQLTTKRYSFQHIVLFSLSVISHHTSVFASFRTILKYDKKPATKNKEDVQGFFALNMKIKMLFCAVASFCSFSIYRAKAFMF